MLSLVFAFEISFISNDYFHFNEWSGNDNFENQNYQEAVVDYMKALSANESSAKAPGSNTRSGIRA